MTVAANKIVFPYKCYDIWILGYALSAKEASAVEEKVSKYDFCKYWYYFTVIFTAKPKT